VGKWSHITTWALECTSMKRLLIILIYEVLGMFQLPTLPLFIRCQFHQRFTRALFVRMFFLCLEFGFERTFVQKTRSFNVDEIDPKCQYRQHFTSRFLYESFLSSFSLLTVCICLFCCSNIAKKADRKNVD